jgi:hypothetical protein
MLRITVHRDGGQCRLELSGRLCGPWVGETETVWRSAACSGEEIEVDMREVSSVDDAGCKLLAAMHEAGARFVAQGFAMTVLIEEITGKLRFNGDKRQTRREKRSQGRRFPDQERK